MTRSIFLTFILAFTCILLGHAQSSKDKCKSIDQVVLKVNKHLPDFTKTISHYSASDKDSSYREIYTDKNKQVTCLTLNNYTPKGHQIVKYYFKNEQFIYCLQSRYFPDKEPKTEHLYFAENQLIEWIDAKGNAKDKTENDYYIVNQDLANYAYSLVLN